MDTIAKRMLELRTSLNLPQMRLSKTLGISQAAINRYEHNQATVPHTVLLKYADYFDVSADYLLGRTDRPEGKLYEFKPKVENSAEMKQFIDMCFDPNSPMSDKLKDVLLEMMMKGSDE